MRGSKLYSFSQTLHEHKGDYAPGGSAPKREICRSLPTASFNPIFALRVVAKLYDFDEV